MELDNTQYEEIPSNVVRDNLKDDLAYDELLSSVSSKDNTDSDAAQRCDDLVTRIKYGSDPDEQRKIAKIAIARIVDLYETGRAYEWRHGGSWHGLSGRRLFNTVVAWGMPSERNLDIIIGWLIEWTDAHPTARVFDFGCGSGIFTALLREKATALMRNITLVPVDTITTVSKDRPVFFCPVQTPEAASIPSTYTSEDVFFMSWGYGGCGKYIDEFVEHGGRAVVILGEGSYGCTVSADRFYYAEGWKVRVRSASTACSPNCPELLTFNVLQ